MEINGYVMEGDFSSENAGCSLWGFCRKYEHSFFIKRFTEVTYPISDKISASILEKKRAKCEKYYNRKKQFYNLLSQCRNGNIIVVHDFFRHGSYYYAVSDRVVGENLPVKKIVTLSNEKKILLFKSILYSFAIIHSKKIIHSDIKPENILVVPTIDGYCTGKIIDFDLGFSMDCIPKEIGGDFLYYSPEIMSYSKGNSAFISTASDVFSLGLLFHLYCCGELPRMPPEYKYACECINDGKKLTLDSSIPKSIQTILKNMLKKDPKKRLSALDALLAFKGMDSDVTDTIKFTSSSISYDDFSIDDSVPSSEHEEGGRTPSKLKIRMKSSGKRVTPGSADRSADKGKTNKSSTYRDFHRPTDFD